MKPLFLILLSFLLFSCEGRAHKNGLENEKLKGKVKVNTTRCYSVKIESGKPVKDSLTRQYSNKYNVEGNISDGDILNMYGKTIGKSISKYDDKGTLLEIGLYKTDGSLISITKYKYNDQGQMIEQNGYSDDKLTYAISYKYDSSGFKVEENSSFSANNSANQKLLFTYDSRGNEIKSVAMKDDKKSNYSFTYGYNDSDNVVSENFYDANGNMLTWSSYKYLEYDKAGNWIKRIKFKNDEPVEITEREIEYYQ
jgi:hypothetical protein